MDNEVNNKSVWNEPFFIYRKINKCYGTAVSFISDRFLKIIKLALPVVIISAIGITALLYMWCDAGIELSVTSYLWFYVLAIGVSIITVSLVMAVLYRIIDVNIEGLNVYSVGYRYVYNRVFVNKFARAICFNLIVLAIGTLLVAAIHFIDSLILTHIDPHDIDEKSFIINWTIRIVAFIIIMVILIPMYIPLNKLMLHNKGFKQSFLNGYKMGWTKWGKIFSLEVLVVITITIIALFVLAPAYVIALMQHSATLSKIQGDAVDVPEYFTYITILILFIASVFIVILMLFKFLPQAYLYASVLTDEQQIDRIKTAK